VTRRRGFTLIELTIYSALLSMLLLAIYGVFVASMRYFRVSQTASDLQSSAQKCVLKVVADLSESTLSSMKITASGGTEPPGIIFLSARNGDDRFTTSANGDILWQKWVCYYYDKASGTIFRNTQAFSPTAMPPVNTLSTSAFQALAGAIPVANNCTSFSITGTSALNIQATFQGTVFSNATHTPDAAVSITDTFNVRN
jgi:prepilin-type N-terminal cleavage/methylation domain-containing protein